MEERELAERARRRLEATGRMLPGPPGHPDVGTALGPRRAVLSSPGC